MAICLNLGSLDCEILQMKNTSLNDIFRILNPLKIRTTQRPLFKLYGMAMCLNLESLDRKIL